ncbi:hypothetical protein B566_EDAN017365 [Ephemera danica]|nr:hypothetical protein B566_EDAN017365 [Ephemera danica]
MAINGLVCFCLLLGGVFSATSEPQESYQVLRTTPIKDGVDLKTLLRNPNYDILSPPRLGRVMDVMTSLEHCTGERERRIEKVEVVFKVFGGPSLYR